MSEIFSPVGQARITRRSKNELNLPFRKTNTGQNGLSYIGPNIWNSLQGGIKSSNDVNSFKHKIKDKFFNDLQNRKNSPYIYRIIRFLKLHRNYPSTNQKCNISDNFSAIIVFLSFKFFMTFSPFLSF